MRGSYVIGSRARVKQNTAMQGKMIVQSAIQLYHVRPHEWQ